MGYNIPVLEIREIETFSSWLRALRDAQARARIARASGVWPSVILVMSAL